MEIFFIVLDILMLTIPLVLMGMCVVYIINKRAK